MDSQLIFFIVVAGAITAVGFFLSRLFVGGKDEKLHQRLVGGTEGNLANEQQQQQESTRSELLTNIAQKAAQPFMPSSREKQSTMRKQLNFAGIYSTSAPSYVTAAKVIFMVGGVGIGYFVGGLMSQTLLGLSLGGLVGYFLPRFWLKQKIKSNQQSLNLALPDALDLMVVCVEAGLTVDAAMQRVGQELGIAHPALSRELGIAHMETRVGLSRAESLKNLGVRTGSNGLQSLASMLIQADRFGTSIANALRIQAEALRTKRQHAAEEMAAKASVKLSFPLVLFIFPATFIVLAGPTVIGLMRSALFTE
ncbi:MAG: type II secretion system F family protein [Anaerolineae bacterium]|nr:type II secretion system F family protein [Phycisphaerae bacterium]